MTNIAKHELYPTWVGLRQRCNDSNASNYKYYGGRGITVCERWDRRGGFHNFLADMGERPEGYTLDRIDNSGDYSPENCRWASLGEQQSNTRKNRLFTIGGVTKTLSQWVRESRLNYSTVAARFYAYGWPIEDALRKPLAQGRKYGIIKK